MNIANWLQAAALEHGARPALYRGLRLHATYRDFARRAAALADWLRREHGLAPGDRVALFARNRVEYLELLYAAWWLGAVAVPINPKLHPKEVGWIAANADVSVVLPS